MSIRLLLQEIKDRYTQDNFKRLSTYLNDDPVAKGLFKFYSIDLYNGTGTTITNLKVPHNLGFQPLDVIQLSVVKPDTAAVVWHYDRFDKTNILLSASGLVAGQTSTVRIYLGRYGEGL